MASEHYIRLTVARRQRYCTVFPSTKSAVDVEGQGPLRVKDFGGMKPPGWVDKKTSTYSKKE